MQHSLNLMRRSTGSQCNSVKLAVTWSFVLRRLTLMISFVSKGFPYKDQIEELFVVMVYCMYSQHITLSTFSD